MPRLCLVSALVFCLSHASFAQDRQVYFGQLHSHTSLSDGSGTPAEAYDSARNAGLHFFALTEHNHSEAAGPDGVFLTPANYQQLKQMAATKTVDGEFVAIYGQEVSTISKGNHENVFFAPEVINMPNGDFRFLYENWMPTHPEATIIQLNHPRSQHHGERADYGIDDYNGRFEDLLSACDRYVGLIEVIKGPTETTTTSSPHVDGHYADDYFYYLNRGFHVAPSVGGDEHRKTWGKTMKARIGIWATELTRSGLEEALQNRHAYATEDDSIVVQLRIGNAIMGDAVTLAQPGSVNATVSFSDPNEPNATHRVQIYYDDATNGQPARQIHSDLIASGANEVTFPCSVAPGGYLFAKIVQLAANGAGHADDTWTAPIWFTAPNTELFAGPAGISDPAPTDDVDWRDAADHVGQTVTVKGTVVRVHNHENRILFINFAQNFNDTLSLVIYRDNFEDFDPFEGVDALDERLVGKTVRVNGKITKFRNSRLQLVIRDPAQILSVDETP